MGALVVVPPLHNVFILEVSVKDCSLQAQQRRQHNVNRRQPVALRPAATSCICRNNCEPDENGFIYISPNCIVHKPHRPWTGVPVPRTPTAEERRAVDEIEALRKQQRQKMYLKRMRKR
jgi:hypothetical protein